MDKYSDDELRTAADIIDALAPDNAVSADLRDRLVAEIAHREVMASYDKGRVIEVSVNSPEFDATCGPVPLPHFFHGSMTPRS